MEVRRAAKVRDGEGGVIFVGEGWAGGCFKEMHHKCNQN